MPAERKFKQRQNGANASILCAGLVLSCGLTVVAAPAEAQTVVAQIGVASEYVGKGLGKSGGDPSVNAKARIGYSPDSVAATREAWWYELAGTVSAGPKTKVSASIADRTADGGAEYAAWNVGVKHKLTQKLAMDVRWYDTDSHAYGENYEGRLAGALTYQF